MNSAWFNVFPATCIYCINRDLLIAADFICIYVVYILMKLYKETNEYTQRTNTFHILFNSRHIRTSVVIFKSRNHKKFQGNDFIEHNNK